MGHFASLPQVAVKRIRVAYRTIYDTLLGFRDVVWMAPEPFFRSLSRYQGEELPQLGCTSICGSATVQLDLRTTGTGLTEGLAVIMGIICLIGTSGLYKLILLLESSTYPVQAMRNQDPYSGPTKLVLGFDIGTVASAVSYCILEQGRIPQIHRARQRCPSLSYKPVLN